MLKHIEELHKDHIELISEIHFLQQEINFFLKLLSGEYSRSINNTKIKLLDNYYSMFEKNLKDLISLEKEVKKEEKVLAAFSQNKKENILLPEKEKSTEYFYSIQKEVRLLKESLYALLIQHFS